MATEKLDKPWWGKKDTLWGGETFTATEDKPKVGVANGDKFRVEKKGLKRTLSPHHNNDGTLRAADGEMKPLELEKVGDPKNYMRAYGMMASVVLQNPEGEDVRVAKTLFLAERAGGSVVIADHLDGPGSDESTASVER